MASYFVERAPRKQSFLGRGRAAYTEQMNNVRECKHSVHIHLSVHATTEFAKFPVAMRYGVTPVPIPNTMVKTQAADDTALETMWESRWVPGSIKGLIAQPVRAHA